MCRGRAAGSATGKRRTLILPNSFSVCALFKLVSLLLLSLAAHLIYATSPETLLVLPMQDLGHQDFFCLLCSWNKLLTLFHLLALLTVSQLFPLVNVDFGITV